MEPNTQRAFAVRRKQPAEPHEAQELISVLTQPLRIFDLVMTERDRLVATIAGRRNAGALTLVLLVATALFSFPFGAVIDPARAWRIALLLVGSVAICLPSLHVFSAFLGLETTLGQTVSLTLVIACVSALFTFGFAPIVWFLDTTMEAGELVTAHDLAVILLWVSIAAGLVQLLRCLGDAVRPGTVDVSFLIVIPWQCVFVYITYRMARVLGLI